LIFSGVTGCSIEEFTTGKSAVKAAKQWSHNQGVIGSEVYGIVCVSNDRHTLNLFFRLNAENQKHSQNKPVLVTEVR